MQPLVSCVVPVFNGERYVADALASIAAQTYTAWEIIVVDDGSTDRTAAVIAASVLPVVCLTQPNAGPAAARNRGIGAARGDFIAFLDADDLWHPEKLTKQMARFVARPELEASVTYQQNFWTPEGSGPSGTRGHQKTAPQPGYIMQTLLARRHVFETVGLLNTTLRQGEDTEWFLRAVERGIVSEVLPEVLCRRRLHAGNLTRRLVHERDENMLRVVKEHLDRRRGR